MVRSRLDQLWWLAALAVVGAALVAALVLERSGSSSGSGSTFAIAGPREDAEVWAVGDGAGGEPEADQVVALIADSDPDRLLYLGDVYERGTAEEFARNYRPSWGRLSSITAPTLGNHEAPNAAEGYEPYWRGVRGQAPPEYYAFEAGGWEILSLNSEIDAAAEAEQLDWLQSEVEDGGNCRIAFWHRPRYNAGLTHSDDASVEPLWSALEGRARLVINGHEHNMQRMAPRDGITELIVGSGGYTIRDVDPDYPGLEFADTENDGALRLRLNPGRARFSFIAVGGGVLDSGAVSCEQAS